jgi:hypothetical protein
LKPRRPVPATFETTLSRTLLRHAPERHLPTALPFNCQFGGASRLDYH